MSGMPVSRCVLLVVVLVLGALLGCRSEGGRTPDPSPVAAVATELAVPTETRPAVRPAVRALEILRRWDRLRAAAYAAGEPASLRRLYSPGSWAGARDVRLLRRYAERGLVVRELRMQVLDVEVLAAATGTLRLRVVERLAGATVVDGASQVALPTGRARSRVLTFDDVGKGWRVRSVRRG